MKKIVKIIAILLGILLIGLSAFIFYSNNYKEEVIYTSSYKGKEALEIYTSIKKDTNFLDAGSIKGNNDEIVINTFKVMTNRYSNVDEKEYDKDIPSDCAFIGSSVFKDSDLSVDIYKTYELKSFISCVSATKITNVSPKSEAGELGFYERVVDKDGYDKLKSYYPELDLSKYSDVCTQLNYVHDECKKDYYFLQTMGGIGDNELVADIESITRKGANYTVVINIYSGDYNEDYSKVVSSKKLITYTYDVTLSNNHIVINNIK